MKLSEWFYYVDALTYLYKMKLESGCTDNEARKWVYEMWNIYGPEGDSK